MKKDFCLTPKFELTDNQVLYVDYSGHAVVMDLKASGHQIQLIGIK
jgi:hypothetical protein